MSQFKSVRHLVLAALFVALGVVLQIYSIKTPIARIGLSPIPIMLSGLFLGPVTGGIVGLAKDLIGVLIDGNAPFPWITLVQIMYGVLPALFLRPLLKVFQGKFQAAAYFLGIALIQLINGTFLNTAALTLLLDGQITMPFFLARLGMRLPGQVIHIILYPVVTYVLVMALAKALQHDQTGVPLLRTSK